MFKRIVSIVSLSYLALYSCERTGLKYIETYDKQGRVKTSHYEDELGDWYGERKYYYPNGKVSVTMTMQKSKVIGPGCKYYESGKICSRGYYKEKGFVGKVYVYSETGKIQYIEEYNEKHDLLKKTEYFDNGKVSRMSGYFSGNQSYSENYKVYYPNGKLNEAESNFMILSRRKNKLFFKPIQSFGGPFKPDSTVINIVEKIHLKKVLDYDYTYSSIPDFRRKVVVKGDKPIAIEINENDFIDNQILYIVNTYGRDGDNYIASSTFMRYKRGEKLPKDNVELIPCVKY